MKKNTKVIKFKRRVNFHTLPKILLVISCFVFVFAFAFSSYAYSYDSDNGNLTSDNIYNVNATGYKYLYNSWSGNAPSSSSATTVTLTDTGFAATGGGGNFVYYGIPVAFNTGTYKITCSLANTRRSGFTLLDRTSNSILYRNENISSTSFSTTVTITDSSHSYYVGFAMFFESSYTQTFSDIMVYDSDLTLTSYEPFGIEWYSSTQYENYGSSQYSQGYNNGTNDVLDNLVDMEVAYLSSSVSVGVYSDASASSPMYRATITDSSSSGTGRFLKWNLDNDTNNVWYRITVSFNENYIFKNIKWTPNRFSNTILSYGSNEFSNVTYNGSYYGFFDLEDSDSSGYGSFILTVHISSSVSWSGFTFYVDALNLDLSNTQEIAQSNYDSGYGVGYEDGYSSAYNTGYDAGVASVEDANSNYKMLIWTIAGTPWESFKHIWSFDILGLNIANIVIGFIMVLLLLYLIKKIWR